MLKYLHIIEAQRDSSQSYRSWRGKSREKGKLKLDLEEILEVVVYQAKGGGLPFKLFSFKNKNTLQAETFFFFNKQNKNNYVHNIFYLNFSIILDYSFNSM